MPLVYELPLNEGWCPVAAEFFATTADTYFLLGEKSIDSTIATADGRPLDEANCVARLARCVGADSTTYLLADARRAASYVRELQVDCIVATIDQLTGNSPSELLFCGQGEFLATEIAATAQAPFQLLSSLLPQHDSTLSRCAPAYAVACLAAKRSEAQR